MTIIFSFIAGILLGVVFSVFDLPIPAPPNLAGVMGIVGVFLGYALISTVIS
ncbi:hypothetical protein JNUCC1_00519 [Lentibacillus sp. JNUCC-1]|nr:hypothetical protein [Lentibacillus sp. JNUCC-1]